MVVARRGGPQYGEWLIDILGWRIAGDGGTRRIRFLDEVVAVIGVDARGGRRRFVNAFVEGIVFEARGCPSSRSYSHCERGVIPRSLT